MPRLSKLIEKLEDKAEARFGAWFARYKAKLPFYIPLVLLSWYIYGLFLNSLQLGIASTFSPDGKEIESIWVFSPFKNWFVVFTPFGLGVTAVAVLLVCLITKKGYSKLSGYKFIRDPRGFDILPDGTHGTSGFLSEKEMRDFLELEPVDKVQGMLLGKSSNGTLTIRTSTPSTPPTG